MYIMKWTNHWRRIYLTVPRLAIFTTVVAVTMKKNQKVIESTWKSSGREGRISFQSELARCQTLSCHTSSRPTQGGWSIAFLRFGFRRAKRLDWTTLAGCLSKIIITTYLSTCWGHPWLWSILLAAPLRIANYIRPVACLVIKPPSH